MLVHISRLHWLQVAGNMAAIQASVDRGRVESVIVTWRQVNHHVVQLIALGFDGLEQGLHLGIVAAVCDFVHFLGGVCGVSNMAEKELIKAVGTTLHAINGAIDGAHLTNSEDAAVTGRADRCIVILGRDLTHLRLEGPGEKVCERIVQFKSIALSLLNFDAINSREQPDHGVEENAWNLSLANVASNTTLNARDRHRVAQLVELFEQLVAEDNVEDASNKLNQRQVTVYKPSW